MYLNYLADCEKVPFLKLAHAIGSADGTFCENEQTVIDYYCNEMRLKDVAFDPKESIDDLAGEFKSMRSKRIAILELMSIINANGEFKKEEKAIIDLLIEKFDIASEYIDDVRKWTELMLSVVEQGNSLIES